MDSDRIIMEGTGEECFRDMVERFAWDNPQRALLTDFCEAERVTVTRWLNGSSTWAGGEKATHVRCFMALAGYRIVEFSTVDRVKRLVFFAIALDGFVTADDVRKRIGFPNFHQLWKVLRSSSPSPKADPVLRAIVDEYEDVLELEIRKWGALIRETLGAGAASAAPAPEPPAPQRPVLDTDTLAKVFSEQIRLTATLASITATGLEDDQQAMLDGLNKYTNGGEAIHRLCDTLEGLLDVLDVLTD